MCFVSHLCSYIDYFVRGCVHSDRELDHAMLRRLEKRILVDLPTREARRAMIEFHLPQVINPGSALEIETSLDYNHLADVRVLS